MSQAVTAPNMGDPVLAPDKVGIMVGRRAMLSGLALAPAALAVPAVALVPGDAPFWSALARHRMIDVEWTAAMVAAQGDEDAEEATFDQYAPEEHRALQALVLARVSTSTALLAKLRAVDGVVDMDTGDDAYPDFWACLVRDVERLVA